jgi:hypothetical protein
MPNVGCDQFEFIGGCIAGLAGVFATSVTVSSGATGAGSTNNFASLAGLSLTLQSVTGLRIGAFEHCPARS